MVQFENSYLNLWKNTIEEARNGLKVYLLKKNEKEYTFEINADEKYCFLNYWFSNKNFKRFADTLRLLLLFEESNWLSRLNIDIPASAKELLSQVTKKRNKF